MSDKHVKSGNFSTDGYLEKANSYVKATGIDFLVADLGIEQQPSNSGGVKYLKERARGLTSTLGRMMLVLHGTSSRLRGKPSGLKSICSPSDKVSPVQAPFRMVPFKSCGDVEMESLLISRHMGVAG